MYHEIMRRFKIYAFKVMVTGSLENESVEIFYEDPYSFKEGICRCCTGR
jgi:hypothetical protein